MSGAAELSALLRKKLRHLAQEFVSLNKQDASEPIHKRFGSVCFLMTRPWATAIFNEFIKPETKSLKKISSTSTSQK